MDNQQSFVDMQVYLGGSGQHEADHYLVEEFLSSNDASTVAAGLEWHRKEPQAMIDAHYRALESGDLDPARTAGIRKSLLRFSEASGLRPAVFHVEGVQVLSTQPVVMMPGSNVLNGIQVATSGLVSLKTRRRLRGWGVQDAKKALNREAIFQRFGGGHSGILSLIGVLEISSPIPETYLVCPSLQNGTILQYLSRTPDADRRTLVKGVTDALRYLHDAGIIHGDLRGINILIKSDGSACISNFSSARLINEDASTWLDVMSIGSIPWQAPELLQAPTPFTTKATDVYAFGCLVYEIYTGKHPLWDITGVPRMIVEVCYQNRRPTKPQTADDPFARFGLSEEVWGIMEMCWAGNPHGRPTTTGLVQNVASRVDGQS